MTFSELAKEVGVPTGTLYRTFPSKDDLLVYLFSDFISKLNDSMMRFYKMDLSPKEKIICSHCYQFYLRGKVKDNNGLDLLATNHIIFDSAKSETINIFKKTFEECGRFQISRFEPLQSNGFINAKIDTFLQVHRQLVLLSRGGMFISNHIFINQDSFVLEDLIDACSLILDKLNWQDDHGRTDVRLITLALDSEFERAHSKSW